MIEENSLCNINAVFLISSEIEQILLWLLTKIIFFSFFKNNIFLQFFFLTFSTFILDTGGKCAGLLHGNFHDAEVQGMDPERERYQSTYIHTYLYIYKTIQFVMLNNCTIQWH